MSASKTRVDKRRTARLYIRSRRDLWSLLTFMMHSYREDLRSLLTFVTSLFFTSILSWIFLEPGFILKETDAVGPLCYFFMVTIAFFVMSIWLVVGIFALWMLIMAVTTLIDLMFLEDLYFSLYAWEFLFHVIMLLSRVFPRLKKKETGDENAVTPSPPM